MRIGFDIQALQTGTKGGGIGRYSYNLLHELIKIYPGNEYILFNNGLYDKNSVLFTGIENVLSERINYFPFHDFDPINSLIQKIHYRSINLDLLHILSFMEPYRAAVITDQPLSERTIVNLYDLIPLIFKDLYLYSVGRKHEYFNRLKNVTSADLILTISEASRKDAINLLGISPEKIINIGCASSDEFYHVVDLEPSIVQRIKYQYGIDSNFIFTLGSIDIRKNHKNLITAFSNLPPDMLNKYTLVIACNYEPPATKELRDFAEKHALSRVKFLHFPSDEVANILYNSCDLFVMASLYEGFGLPVLEAMKCGAPVIASNNSSIPEITGRTDILFDPRNVESMARLMAAVLGNINYRMELKNYGMVRAQGFSWRNVAQRAMEAYEYHLNNRKTVSKLGKSICLGIVTTWNTRCGIANYSKYLIDSIELRVKIFANYDCELMGLDEPNIFRCWYRQGAVDRLFDEIRGQDIDIVDIQYNNSFFGIEQLAKLILLLKKQKIKVIVTIHDAIAIPRLSYSLKDISVELQCADVIILFNEGDLTTLKSYGISENAILFTQGFLTYDDEDRFAARKAKRLNNSKIIATCGFLLPHKGVLEVIKSLQFLVHIYPDILYLAVCPLYPDPISHKYFIKCKKAVKQLKLMDNVIFFTDYLEEHDVIHLLHAADILVLPYKKTEQPTSAAVRFAMSAGRPAITTAHSIFDAVKEEVYQIAHCEPKTIAEAIQFVYENDDLYKKLKKASIEKSGEENWDAVAKRYTDIILNCYANDNNRKFKLIKLIDDMSEELVKVGLNAKKNAIDIVAKEIYRLYRTNEMLPTGKADIDS